MKTGIKIVVILAIVAVAGGAAGWWYVNNKSHRDVSSEKAVFELTAQQIFDEYRADESAANESYLDKTGIVSSALTSVEQTNGQAVIVFALGDGMFGDEGIRCSLLPEQESLVEKLKEGEVVKVKGICKGFNQVDVIFQNCLIID